MSPFLRNGWNFSRCLLRFLYPITPEVPRLNNWTNVSEILWYHSVSCGVALFLLVSLEGERETVITKFMEVLRWPLMRLATVLFFTVLIVVAQAAAQSTQSPNARPAYEAASITLDPGSIGGSSKGSRGQAVVINQSLKHLVERAYAVKPFQSVSDVRLATLRTLLEDRFIRPFITN